MDAKAVGQRIARARREKGWTQRQLAEHLHISDRTVSKWERGAGLPDVALLVPLADALGLTVTELLDGARETMPSHPASSRSGFFREEEELLELCEQAENTGDGGVKARLTEQLLPEVIRTARGFAGRGLPLGDLIQEGNIGLMLAMETLGLRAEGQTALDYLKQEIRSAVSAALEEQQTERQAGDLLAERLNHLSDGIKKLSDELERKVSLEELSVFMDMPVEEIEDLLKLAGEGTGDGGEDTEER